MVLMLLCSLCTSKIQKYAKWKQMKAACGLFATMNKTPFKIFFGKMRLKSMQQLEDLGVVNYIGMYIWTIALGGIYHGDKFGIFVWQW